MGRLDPRILRLIWSRWTPERPELLVRRKRVVRTDDDHDDACSACGATWTHLAEDHEPCGDLCGHCHQRD
jgi:hypothetical protein